MIELERTYLAKVLPPGLENSPVKELLDIYVPAISDHPNLRIRKNAHKFEINKKTPVEQGDSSRQTEETINITESEFNELAKIQGKRVHKLRYLYQYAGRELEVDVFQDDLKGLVLVDAEFETEDEMGDFGMPDFCLVDVTQEEFIAGGMLCGKAYSDIADQLEELGYKAIEI